jgi:uncharacterized protein (DUF1786 family)
MGGGASSAAVEAHLAAGLDIFATSSAARSLHNDLDRVRRMGVQLVDSPPPGSTIVRTGDVDIDALRLVLSGFEIELPSLYAIAVQDHGYLPGAGGREFRYEFLQSLLQTGGDLRSMAYREPPDYMIRMRGVAEALPGAIVMDTGAAAVLGVLGDPVVAEHAVAGGAILVNIGNMHTFAIALRGTRVYGLFEHHTGGITAERLHELVSRLSSGHLTNEEVVALGGHGAAFDPAYRASGPFEFVAITGPNRALARPLGYHEAVPHGDMMLSGSYGLVDGALAVLRREGFQLPLESIAVSGSAAAIAE